MTAHADRPTARGTLLLLSDKPLSDPQTAAFAVGPVDFNNLSPGSYRLYAVSDLENLEYANPEAMRSLPSESITLTPNHKASVSIQFVSRAGQ